MAKHVRPKVDILNYIFVILFGLSSWISINSIWVQLPIFVNNLPEKWTLPSFFSIIIQLGNISTIIFTVYNIIIQKRTRLNTALPNNSSNFVALYLAPIYFILLLQISSCISVAFYWQNQSFIAGSVRSSSLLILVFFLSLTNCASNVVFLPYLSQFSSSYITAYYIGSGLSGFIPSFLSLIQGIGGTPKCQKVQIFDVINSTLIDQFVPEPLKPRFSVSTFFIIITCLITLSMIAFTCLNIPSILNRRNRKENSSSPNQSIQVEGSTTYSDPNTRLMEVHSPQSTKNFDMKEDASSPSKLNDVIATKDIHTQRIIKNGFFSSCASPWILLAILVWISALANGIIPSLQSYATLPFGSMTFHLTVSLASLANPIASFLAFFWPIKTKSIITQNTAAIDSVSPSATHTAPASENKSTGIEYRQQANLTFPRLTKSVSIYKTYYTLVIIATIIAAFIFAIALKSPNPWLAGTFIGSAITIIVWILIEGLFSYIKVCSASEFHTLGGRWLLWCGVATQMGSAIGAFTIFFLINSSAQLFKSGQSCIMPS